MVEKKVIVTHKVGLHARPASVFVQTAAKFASDITVDLRGPQRQRQKYSHRADSRRT